MNDIDDEKLRLALLEEFADSKERWTDQRLENIKRCNDLQVGVSERNFQLILALVSISVAFLTIVIPITQNSIQTSLLIPMILSFVAALVGIVYLFLVTWWDRRCISADNVWGLNTYGRYQKSATEIYADLYTGSIPQDKIDSYWKLSDEINQEAKDRAKKRNESFPSRLLNILHYSFLVLFALSFISLFLTLLSGFMPSHSDSTKNQMLSIHSQWLYFFGG